MGFYPFDAGSIPARRSSPTQPNSTQLNPTNKPYENPKCRVYVSQPPGFFSREEVEARAIVTFKKHFWSTPQKAVVFKRANTMYFRWGDTGELTPKSVIENAFDAYKASL